MVRVVDYEDDDYLSAMYSNVPFSLGYEGNNSRNPFSFQNKAEKASLESYCDDLIQAIEASLEAGKNKIVSDFSQDYDGNNDDFQERKYSHDSTTTRKLCKGESSNSKAETVHIDTDDHQSWEKTNNVGKHTFVCCVCVDEKFNSELFESKGCPHSYCSECVAKHVAATLKDKNTNVKCPVLGCEARLKPQHCRSILPPRVVGRWGDAVLEAWIKDRAMGDDAKCPHCGRLRAQCVPWRCFQFQLGNKDKRQKKHI